MDDVRSNFAYEDSINIEKCVDTLNLFINAFNDKKDFLVLSSIARDQKTLRNDIVHMMQAKNIEYLFYPYPIEDGREEIISSEQMNSEQQWQMLFDLAQTDRKN